MPCLWKVKSKEYLDRNKKERAYDVLANKLRQVDPEANRDKVVKKINSLRSSFRKEVRKCRLSKEANPDDSYTPRLWYYDALLFLRGQDQDENEQATINNRSPVPFNDERELDEDDSESKEDPFALVNVSVLPAEFSTATRDIKVAKHSDERIPETAVKRLASTREEDEFDVVAKNIANKLRKLTPMQALVTEKRINDVLFEAQMENLQTNAPQYENTESSLNEFLKIEPTRN